MHKLLILFMCAPFFACSILLDSPEGAESKSIIVADQKANGPEVVKVDLKETSYRNILLKLLKQGIPGIEIAEEAITDLNRSLNNLATHLCRASSNGLTEAESLTTKKIEAAVGEILFGKLIEHANNAGANAVGEYKKADKKEDARKAAELVFPVGLSKNFIDHQNTDLEFDIYLSAVLEYMAVEILYLSGNSAIDRAKENEDSASEDEDSASEDEESQKVRTITIEDIKKAIAEDEELNAVKENGFL